jgi:hypothetical protein
MSRSQSQTAVPNYRVVYKSKRAAASQAAVVPVGPELERAGATEPRRHGSAEPSLAADVAVVASKLAGGEGH